MLPLDYFDKECLMTADNFIELVKDGIFIPYDGTGYWATENEKSRYSVFNLNRLSTQPQWATHVVWYNK